MGNKAARTVMIGGVIFYSLLYPLPFHNEVPQKLPLFVVDQARSDLSRQLMRMIDSTEGVRVARRDGFPSARAGTHERR